MNICPILFAVFLAVICPPAEAVPSTFEPVIGNALLCQDNIDPPYFQDYLTTHFKAPYKTEGGAYWHKTDGVRLYGIEVTEIFVSTGADQVDFLGVVFNAKLSEARQKLLADRGVAFVADPDGKTLRSPPGSFLIEYNRTKSKLFCVKYRVGR